MAARPPARRRGKRRSGRSLLGVVTASLALVIVAFFVVLLEANRPRVGGDSLRLDTFVDLVQRGSIETATILDFDGYVVGRYLGPDGRHHRYNAVYLKEGRERLVTILLDSDVRTRVEQQTGKRLVSLASYVLPGLLLVLLFVYLIISSQRQTGLFKVRSGARKIEPDAGTVTFADVAGQDAAVAELREVTDFLADPARYTEVGATIPKGVLLYGPPGCGKTLLARAVAGEAHASFYTISGSDFVELYVGVGAARVRDLFRVAREDAPAVVFIDEIDSIGRSRSSAGAASPSDEREQALNQILAEMDGFSPSDGLIVLAATNRPDVLDPALLRPGRFDRSVGLERPDDGARLAILETHARGKQLAPDASLPAVAAHTVGFTGADLASVLNEAALLAARAGRRDIGQAQLDEAVQRILAAPERQRRLSLRERSVGRRYSEEDKVTFADVAGQEAAVAELREVKEYLAEPERYAAVGAELPRGVLLYGPPGCGKTLLARALAGETHAAFLAVSAGEFSSRYVGDSAERIRNLFAEARQMAPAIVFIDEVDSLGGSRVGSAGDRAGAQPAAEEALNQILTELDGFTRSSGVIVLAATNRPDVLDPALLRPGRFDRSIALEWPSAEARLAILRLHAQDRPLAPDADLAALAARAHGLTGAELANVVNEAALLTARAGRRQVGQADLEQALRRTIEAPDRQRRLALRARSVGRRAADERVTFADVVGADDAVEELRDVTDYLAEPQSFARLGASPPRGILLSGPPGCGKTLLARAVAGEAHAAFISASASEFVEVFVGEGAARVRDLFAEARSMAPAIVFIDEIDAVGGHRMAGASGGRREFESTLNQLLVELDGFEGREAVVVVAATNRPDMLDRALVRPGRFDRKVEVTLPDRAGRRAILELHAAHKRLAGDVDLAALAGRTQGFSGADLANVMNEAALLATRRGLDRISMAVVDEAVDRAYLGISSRGHVMTDEEKRVVAYHEAGHALAAHGLIGSVPVYKLTILPRGGSLGHCSFLDDHDRMVVTRSTLMARMAASLGGWVAENVVFGEPGSGARTDLLQANALARQMVLEYGMSDEFGPATPAVGRGPDGELAALPADVARAVRRLVEEAAGMARSALTTRRLLLDRVAEALLERETLTGEEVEALVTASPARRRPSDARGRAATPGT